MRFMAAIFPYTVMRLPQIDMTAMLMQSELDLKLSKQAWKPSPTLPNQQQELSGTASRNTDAYPVANMENQVGV